MSSANQVAATHVEFEVEEPRREYARQSNTQKTDSELGIIISRLKIIFKDKAQYRGLLSRRDSKAQNLLDLFQELLDTGELDASFRGDLIVATQRLSKSSGLFPTCYNLKGVDYTGDPVAGGSFGEVYQGSFCGRTVCVKTIRLFQKSRVEDFLKKFVKEAVLWGQLTHPNICPLYGLYRRGSGLCLVSPWMDNGNLNDYLKRCPQADRRLLACDAAQGLLYLHSNSIIHGDLKGANIVVSASGRARLTDFGLSGVSDTSILAWTSNSSAGSKGGSVRWQAPELFDIETDEIMANTKASDIYALSSVLYEAFSGDVPFADIKYDPAVINKVKKGDRPRRPRDDSVSWSVWGLTEDIWSVMTKCWSEDPSKRLTVEEVIASLTRGLDWYQRPADAKTLSSAWFRKEMGVHDVVESVDPLEQLAELDSLPLLQSESNARCSPSINDERGDVIGDLDGVKAIESLAGTYSSEGRWREAGALLAEVVEKRKQTLGVDNPSTLGTMVNLARAYFNQERWKEAEELMVTVTEKQKQAGEVEDYYTLDNITNLANIYRKLGRWQEAEELHVVVMEAFKRVYGVDDSATLQSMTILASAYNGQSRWQDAEKLLLTAMEQQKRILGEDHSDTLNSMRSLASSYHHQGRLEEAEELQLVVLGRRKQVLGIDNVDTLQSMEDLASTYSKRGRWDKAEDLHVKILEIQKRMGLDEAAILDTMVKIANMYFQQGLLDAAEELEVTVLERRKQMLGVDDPQTLVVMSNLAQIYCSQDKWPQAMKLETEVMKRRSRTLGVGHPATLKSKENLAGMYAKQDQWEEARLLVFEVMTQRRQSLGEHHPDTQKSVALYTEIVRKNSYFNPLKTLANMFSWR